MLENLIYKHKCVGKDKKLFVLYKLKTMKNSLSLFNERKRRNDLIFGKLKKDPRIIKNRKFLRRYFIDELPQIINIIKGDMTILGLRAVSEEGFEDMPQNLKQKYIKFKPGLIAIHYLYNANNFKDFYKRREKYLDEKISKGIISDIGYMARLIFRFLNGSFTGR